MLGAWICFGIVYLLAMILCAHAVGVVGKDN